MGGKTQTSTSSVQIPPEVLARYNAVNARAEEVAATPFQAYSSNPNAFVAPMTATQNQAIGQIANASTMAQPYFQTGAAATMAGMGPANLGKLDTSKYMSPYLQNVVQNTADIIGQQNQQAMSGALGSAIGAGAGWGDRSGIAAANLARQQQMGLGSTIGNLLNQGYMQAQGVAQQQQSADLAARQANLARLMQGGQGLGQLGSGAQGAALAGGQALLGAGTQEQQTNQAGLSALYNQFLQERAYPFQVAQFLGNLAMGTGALSGSTTTTTSPAGFFSGFKKGGKVGGYRRGGLVPESMGGHVASEHMGEGYADGGMPMDYSTMVMQQLFGGTDPSAGAYGLNKMGLGAGSYIPKADMPVGQLMVAKPVEGAHQTNASDIVDMASSLADTGEKAGAMWDKYGPKASPFDVGSQDENKDNLWARGGRTGLAAGGIPYDPSGSGYVPVKQEDDQKVPELLQPKDPQQPESGLSKAADLAKIAMMFMGMKSGGSAYADGGYAVQKGDTLLDIAKKHGLTLADLVKMNPQIRNPDRINIGQNINLPQDRQAAGTPFPAEPSTFPARPGVASAMPAAPRPGLALSAGTPTEGYNPRMPAATPTEAYNSSPSAMFRRALALQAPFGRAVDTPQGMSSEDADRIRSQFYTDYYANQPVQRIQERNLPALPDRALMDYVNKNIDPKLLESLNFGAHKASGGVAGRNGYALAGGIPFNDSDLSDPLVAARIAAARRAEAQANAEAAKTPLPTISGPDYFGASKFPEATALSQPPANMTGIEETARGLVSPLMTQGRQASMRSALEQRGIRGVTASDPLTDFISTRPDEAAAVQAKRMRDQEIYDYYKNLDPYFAANPSEYDRAIKDPRGYYETRMQFAATNPTDRLAPGLAPGRVPAAGNILGAGSDFDWKGQPVVTSTGYKDLSGAEVPPAASVAATSPAPAGSANAAELPVTAQQPGLVPAIPRAREDRPNIAPEEKRSLTPTAAGTAELGPTTEKYKGDDFFGEYIIPRESAGRQFDKNGNPLTSSAGAVGISQMLPSTGPEAAKLAGLEWDENRFYNDPKYNEKLGRAYFNSLLERYNGDTTLASAAYNAGMGRVDKAIARARENGGNWTDYLPGETRKYIEGMPGGTAEPGAVTAGGAGSSGGLGNANIWDQITGKAPGGENIILPFLVGLGKMAGSQSRFLGTALLEGIGGGAEAYMKRQEQLANISQTKASALNSVAAALSNMLVNDGQGNLFVPLQGGGYEPIYSYINNPNRQPSVLGPEIDKVLAEIGAGNVSAVGRLTQLAQQGVNGGIPAQPEVPGNILWDDSANADVANTKALYGTNVNTPANLVASRELLAGAEANAAAAMTGRKTMRNQAKTMVDAIRDGNTGTLNSYINNNILGPIAAVAARAGIEMPSVEDPVSQMQILEKDSTKLASAATTAAEQHAVEALNIMKGATPGVDLTKAANAEIMASLLQLNQDPIDRRAYFGYFQNRTGGLLQGAEASYNDHYAQIQAAEHAQLRKLFEMADEQPLVSRLMDIAASGAPFNEVQGLLQQLLGPDISPALARYLTGGT